MGWVTCDAMIDSHAVQCSYNNSDFSDCVVCTEYGATCSCRGWAVGLRAISVCICLGDGCLWEVLAWGDVLRLEVVLRSALVESM